MDRRDKTIRSLQERVTNLETSLRDANRNRSEEGYSNRGGRGSGRGGSSGQWETLPGYKWFLQTHRHFLTNSVQGRDLTKARGEQAAREARMERLRKEREEEKPGSGMYCWLQPSIRKAATTILKSCHQAMWYVRMLCYQPWWRGTLEAWRHPPPPSTGTYRLLRRPHWRKESTS